MEVKEIKRLAREKMKGHFWDVFKPLLFIMLISAAIGFVVSFVFGLAGLPLTTETYYDFGYGAVPVSSYTPLGSIVNIILSLIDVVVSFGAIYYLVNFVRGKKVTKDDIFAVIKEKWLAIIVASILIGIFVTLWSLLLIIPGIIAAIAYSMTLFIIVDNDLNGLEAIKKSKEMMKGYKGKYFGLMLSFIGWMILSVFTFGILYIWLLPYMELSCIVFYEKLAGHEISEGSISSSETKEKQETTKVVESEEILIKTTKTKEIKK